MKKLQIGLLIISLFIAGAVSGCSVLERSDNGGNGKYNSPPPPPMVDEGVTINSYQELDEIIAFLSDNFVMSTKVKIKSIEVWNDLDRYYAENPNILVSRGIKGMEISYTTGAGGVLNADILPQYEMFMKVVIAHESDDKKSLTAEEKKVLDTAEKIIKSEVTGSTTFEKVESIHNYLTENIVYDENYTSNDNAFNVYGALIEGLAVCQGYTQSFQMLSRMAGIESLIVTGEAGGDSHAWNLVNFGNPEWYHIDVTWNDREATSSHRYFNVSDGIMAADHRWNASDYPSASDVRYNYFRYKGIMASSLQDLENKFAALYNANEPSYEILCAFYLTGEDLNFLHNYKDGEAIMYSIDEYDNSGKLLTVLM